MKKRHPEKVSRGCLRCNGRRARNQRRMLKAAATSYNPSVYGARVNMSTSCHHSPVASFPLWAMLWVEHRRHNRWPAGRPHGTVCRIEPTARMMSLLNDGKKIYSRLSWNHSQPSREALTCAGWQYRHPCQPGHGTSGLCGTTTYQLMTFNCQQGDVAMFTAAMDQNLSNSPNNVRKKAPSGLTGYGDYWPWPQSG